MDGKLALTDNMKPGTRTSGRASARLSYSTLVGANLRGMLRELTHLKVSEDARGHGHGSALMREICAEADASRCVLLLTAETRRLAEWYSRFGFMLIQAEPMLMVRANEPV